MKQAGLKIEGKVKISLEDLNINSNSNYLRNPILKGIKTNFITSILLLPPTDQSHFGEKFISFSKIHNNEKNGDKLMTDIYKSLGIIQPLLFSYIESEKEKNKNRRNEALELSNRESLILLCNDSNIKTHFFLGLRNVFAHGNIVERSGLFFLYSISSSDKYGKDEYKKPITFLLVIRDLSKLNSIHSILAKYK